MPITTTTTTKKEKKKANVQLSFQESKGNVQGQETNWELKARVVKFKVTP